MLKKIVIALALILFCSSDMTKVEVQKMEDIEQYDRDKSEQDHVFYHQILNYTKYCELFAGQAGQENTI